ncbi:hypothetical protein [Rugamonas sp. DEMB1]|uniref:hypothetical protein n=1 Tax=Rugamonas sp. DEMB1 TaxID=3039386 RepID=UPI00244D746E|nr:hypothetical protein [Rugamonas sp. DEMB1]WGG52758.1 hypothetical protein QC826_11795 [Rugamonas sp. DEMB1]
MIKDIRFGAVYGAPPIFDADLDEMGYVELSELNISGRLAEEIEKWDKEFQNTFSDDYPPESGFVSTNDLKLHNERGVELASMLQEFLGPMVKVKFIPAQK